MSWKDSAKAIGFILLIGFVFDVINYYQHRFLYVSPLIPEEVMMQSAKPYLVATVSSIVHENSTT